MAGIAAVFLGLVGQSLYLMFFAWTCFQPEDRIGYLRSAAGSWCSILTIIVALVYEVVSKTVVVVVTRLMLFSSRSVCGIAMTPIVLPIPNYDAAITPFGRISFALANTEDDYVPRSHTKRMTTRSAVTKTTASQNFCSVLTS